jgi:hypothetical protein
MSDWWRFAVGAAIAAVAIVFDGHYWYQRGRRAGWDAGYRSSRRERDTECEQCRQRRAEARKGEKWSTRNK